jgi:outer membrane autotransporter protein
MTNRFPVVRWQLLMGVSIAAMGIVPLMPVSAIATPDPCNVFSGGQTISDSQACAQWNGGDLVVETNGTLSATADYTAGVKVISGDVGTFTNNGTVSSSFTGLDNSRTIAGIVNNGVLSGQSTGINNHVSIGSIINTGTILSISVSQGGAIVNQGNIGTVSNSGLIQSKYFAIRNDPGAGSLTITNSGTIAGMIGHDGSTIGGAMTISGGVDDTQYGLLTGENATTASTDIGEIQHRFVDFHFGTGYLLLNDNIDVADNSVINEGATLKLVNGITITGNYRQTGGGLVIQVASPSSFGSLKVLASATDMVGMTGNANISNTTLVMSGNNLAVGDTYTIVGAAKSGTYTITSASVVGTSGRGATTETVGKDLVVTITESKSGGYQSIGAPSGGVGASFGATLDQINNSSSPQAVAFQNNVLAAINSLPSSQQGSAIKKLAPASAANNVQVLNQASAIVQTAIQGRQLLAMSGGSDAATGIAAGGDVKYSTLWGQVLGGSAHMEGNSDQDGFSSKSFGLTTGFDHLLTPNLLAGAAVSWLRSWTDGSNASSGSSNKIDSYQVTLYGSWRQDRLSVDGQVGAGWNHFDQKRQIDFLGSTASADYDGQQYSASSQVGYDFALGDSTTLTPFAGLRWIHARNDSYDETGAGSANNSIDNLNTDSVTHEIGAKAAWQFDTGLGMVSPEVSAAWVHDYTSSAIDTTGRIGGTAFSVQSERLPSDGARIGIAVGLDAFASGSLRVTYDGELRAGYQSQTATVRADWDF